MTKERFHSFVKLVRLMHTVQQDFFLRGKIGAPNAMAQAKVLEKKVDLFLKQFNPATPEHYTWQPNFLALVKALRSEQKLFFETRYDAVKMRCKKMEAELDKCFVQLETSEPQVFRYSPKPVQNSLF